ncbi:hypothetical protein KDD93_06800 [Campylobacter sp. faydin G-24]|uniref:Uncharacterized protein n=1 Tax=Campylobacter anatolicus TaxID=2829105 RepID=A0ABS5HJ37_9BACT|nr:hypothetical protein [Campylobacter anatolicus]MBR8461464.1 hypothetical protein [Campylobacter anatolicus]MBR8464268.1 hypothetical protein [Campylobacter anatolicus]
MMWYMLLGTSGISKEDILNDPLFPIIGFTRQSSLYVEKIKQFNEKYGTDISFYTAYHTRATNRGGWARTDNRLSGYNGGNGPLGGYTQYYEFKICNYGSQRVFLKFDNNPQEFELLKGTPKNYYTSVAADASPGYSTFRLFLK